MDGRAQLRSLALAINGAGDVDAAWAGTGAPVDLRKQCGLCGEDQPVRVPFLRHVCRSCSAIWVPGICGECAHTSVTFTVDGQLSTYASCGCGGALRQVGYVPRPRVSVDPVVAAARKAAVEKSKKRANRLSRAAMVTLALAAVVGTYQLVRSHHAPPPATQPQRTPVVVDDPTLTMQERGARAAARLAAQGEANDAFACASLIPPDAHAEPSASGPDARSREGAGVRSKEFLAGCLGN